MIKYPISKEYVSHWTIYDAIRELIQNGIDADTQNDIKSLNIEYLEDIECLYISNIGTLTRSSLLLGSSSKSDDSRTIGNYGEGYKIASLVLSRNDKAISITSNDTIFLPSIKFDNDFQSDILVIDEMELQGRVNSTIQVEINDITKEEYEQVITNCLLLQQYDQIIVDGEEILLSPEHKGKIFIKGLYVCTKTNLQYGYNFNPSTLILNRDRNIASDFDIQYASSGLWSKVDKMFYKQVIEAIESGYEDVNYLSTHTWYKTPLKEKIAIEFVKDNPTAIPITSQSDRQSYINKGYKDSDLVIVSETKKALLLESSYSIPKLETKNVFRKNMKPKDAILRFKNFNNESFTTKQLQAINELLTLADNWRYKPNSIEDDM